MTNDLDVRIRKLAGDNTSSASALLPGALLVLRAAIPLGREVLRKTAAAVCLAQPGMASFWNAAAAALRGPDALDRFDARLTRSLATLAVQSVQTLSPARAVNNGPRFLTCSASGSVRSALLALKQQTPLRVGCAEGRPLYEGRNMASDLARAGVAVELFTDAGLESAFRDAEALLLGADAITPEWVINKVGSGALVAYAHAHGVPVYVLAGRDKFLPSSFNRALQLREGAPCEVWQEPSPGVLVRNPYFVRVDTSLASGFITDLGTLDATMLSEACRGVAVEFGSDELLTVLFTEP